MSRTWIRGLGLSRVESVLSPAAKDPIDPPILYLDLNNSLFFVISLEKTSIAKDLLYKGKLFLNIL
jgi:hypothetical protein